MFSLSNDSPVNVKVFVAILLIAAAPAYAQAQSRSPPKVTKGDAQKVVTIIRSDKAKIQTNCEINKVSDQMNQAYKKNDQKRSMICLRKLKDWKKSSVLSMSH